MFRDKNLTCGVIGYGYWAHYPRICKQLGIDVKWIADISHKSLQKAKRDYPGVKTTKNFHDIVNDNSINAVIISTPATTHYNILKELAKYDKHILCEKPLATTSIQAKELFEIYKEKKQVFMLGHTFLFNPAVRIIKEMLDSKEIGDLIYLYFQRTGLGPIREDVNVWWDLAPHDISMLLYFLGDDIKIKEIKSTGSAYIKPDRNDVVFATYKLNDNNILANFHISWLDPIKTRRVTLIGTKKMIVFNDVNLLQKLIIYDKGVVFRNDLDNFGKIIMEYRDGDILIPKIPNKEPLQEEVIYFFNNIVNNTKPDLGNIYHGMRVVELLEKANK